MTSQLLQIILGLISIAASIIGLAMSLMDKK
jgi:hypothetical protein